MCVNWNSKQFHILRKASVFQVNAEILLHIENLNKIAINILKQPLSHVATLFANNRILLNKTYLRSRHSSVTLKAEQTWMDVRKSLMKPGLTCYDSNAQKWSTRHVSEDHLFTKYAKLFEI